MMSISLFKRIFIIGSLVFFTLTALAQKEHFIYLQTENSQPFYIKLNNAVLSSSHNGYVILPGLSEGPHELIVGFPKNEFPEEKFKLVIENRNIGYLIKNMGDQGLSLFNLQTLALINKTAVTTEVAVTKKIEDDTFSTMLAGVVNDSSIMVKVEPVVEKPVVDVPANPVAAVKDTPLDSAIKNVVIGNKDSLTPTVVDNATALAINKAAEPNEAIKTVTGNTPEVLSSNIKSTDIKRVLLFREKEGLEMIYVDRGKIKNDTVRIFMPVKTIENNDRAQIIVTENKIPKIPAVHDSMQLTITPTIITPVENHEKKEVPASSNIVEKKSDSNQVKEKLPVIIYEQPKEEPKKEIKKEEVKDSEMMVIPKAVTSSKVNSDCKKFADDNDFLRLRKKMAAENSNDDMVQVAKKEFKSMCFSTEQIKNLSYLFLDNEGKYMFFDAAYAYTSDTDQYAALQAQLTDEYYINRFKAMIHK